MTRIVNRALEQRLLNEIKTTEGFATSLMDLSAWLEVPYATTWVYLRRLEQAGRITIGNTGPGSYRRKGLKIRLAKIEN